MLTIYEHEGHVKRVHGEFTPIEWLVILKALNWFISYGNSNSDDVELAKKVRDMEQKFVKE